MHLVDDYALTPGCCRLCKDAKTPVVDTLQDIDNEGYEGRLYICAVCCGHLADMVGWVSPEKFKATKAARNSAEKRLAEMKEQFASAREFVVEAFTPDAVEDAE